MVWDYQTYRLGLLSKQSFLVKLEGVSYIHIHYLLSSVIKPTRFDFLFSLLLILSKFVKVNSNTFLFSLFFSRLDGILYNILKGLSYNFRID